MEKILYEVIRILVECVKILVLYRGVLNGKLAWDKRKYLCAVGGIAVMGAGIVLLTGEMDVAYSFGIKIAVCILLAEDRLKGRATGCFVCYIIINIVDSIPATIIIAMGENLFSGNRLYELLINMGMLAVYFFAGIIWHNKRSGEKFVFQKLRWGIIFLFVLEFISCTSIIGSIQMFLVYGDKNGMGIRERILLGVFGNCGCMIMLIISIFQIIASASRDEYKELLENKEKYFQMNYHYYKEMHDFRHDMMKHLKCIYKFCADGKAEKSMNYIQGINKDIHNVDNAIDCGNETISAVVNNIYDKAKHMNIDFRCRGRAPDVNIRDVDLCTVFSNVFENAYESCLKVEGRRMIHIAFKVREERIFMYMENSTAETQIKKNQKLHTKKEGMHGIGMKNVCEVIERYGGTITWKAENGIFVTTIFL